MDRNAQSVLHQRCSSMGRRAKATQAVEFFKVLTSPELLETTEALLPEHRERLYPPTVALSMFMRPMLHADGSCQKAVNGWAAQRAADGLTACSVHPAGIAGLSRGMAAKQDCGRMFTLIAQKVLGGTTRFWLGLEAQYREQLARKANVTALAADVGWLKELPLSDKCGRRSRGGCLRTGCVDTCRRLSIADHTSPH